MNNKKIQKIRAEIERRITLLEKNNVDNPVLGVSAGIVMEELRHLLSFIDSLDVKEEPVSEDLEEASEEWLRPQLDMSYITYGEGKMMELTHFDGYSMLDAIEFGANWQKEQMMKDAVYGLVCGHDDNSPAWIDLNLLNKPDVKVGEEIKLIIIKEE